jgi:phosphate transport system permease protein
MTAIDQPVRATAASTSGELDKARGKPAARIYALTMGIGAVGIAVGLLTTLVNGTDPVMAPLLLLLGVAHAAAVAIRRSRGGGLDIAGVVVAVLAIGMAVITLLLPPWLYGGDINGIIHRTVFSGPALFVVATAGTVLSVRRFMTTPSGQDLALVSLFVGPILLGVLGFVTVLGHVMVTGLSKFRFDLITTAWGPVAGTSEYNIGFLNNILGSFVLPGVGAGVFLSEYPGRVSRVIGFCTTMLRAIAVFILGAAASGVVQQAIHLDSGSFLSMLIRGGWDDGTRIQAQKGSFILAAVFLALLVMPVITRLTEEGLRSVPREMREGSVGLGATDGYGLRRILLPWAAPNILTALILAGAEAAGGLAVIVFIGSIGEHGVSLLGNVTDLDFAVFATQFGPRDYALNVTPEYQMRQYQETAAMLLLVMTMGLTFIAMLLQRRFAKRYRGSITA